MAHEQGSESDTSEAAAQEHEEEEEEHRPSCVLVRLLDRVPLSLEPHPSHNEREREKPIEEVERSCDMVGDCEFD